ncbi:(2,3-dihydroxybenzoyl)adenylate synthase [Paenibacillus urinalis]|uniref:(2,3-dihydroxybenzoyl)adenylate synthase n=1 Tax=Paenibacillus urinalis TaxID=521520 RepID=A0ABY7XHZ7_9BACL|nr:(2,3-dihydroxybenzoyl)adenylate synthase [Paenibacillus urinalis]WDH96186.1 (2,3-dihydroxybenzoyl)adenylate synthase [Paenibacillus urinalis]WDI04409.1 (2,3-dihydroxybenzoyl)adenylate synthase [Paenibacillus urinalis]
MLDGFTAWPQEAADKYREAGYWQGITFGEMLKQRAEVYGDHLAVVSGSKRWSYRELDQKADRLAAGLLKLGIKKEDRVVLQLPNIAEFTLVIFALFRIGALPVFALPSHRKSEIKYLGEYSEAVAYIIADQYSGFNYCSLAEEVVTELPSLQHVIVVGEAGSFLNIEELDQEPLPLPEVRSGDVAFLQLSGGSTGLPKLIPRTHDEYIYSLHGSAEICGLSESSVYMATLPAAHNFPLSSPGVLGTLYAGGRVVMSPGPSPDEAFRLIEREQVTITALVPPLALVWLEAAKTRKEDLSSLEVLQVGGANFTTEAAIKVNAAFDCTLQQVFGMAEGLVNYTRLDDPDELILYTQGSPISPDDEIRIVDEDDVPVAPGEIGHLLTRGPYTIQGYYKADEHNKKAFTKDGFYRTGDLVRLTKEGYLVVEGRAKDQINRGGEKVAAEELENHLLAHEGVYDAAVVSMPDAFLGERTCAYIIPKDTKLTLQEIRRFLRDRGVADYKIPDRVECVESFPMTAVGKVSKKALREKIAAELNPLQESLKR